MKVLLLFAVCLMVTVSWGQPPPPPSPPRISETFSTRFRVEAKSNTVHTYISGDVKRDYMSRKQWTHQITSREGEQRKHDWTLDRCDMNYTFSYHWEGENPQPQGSCESKSYCNFSPIFAWTSNTTYSETIDYEHQRIDVFVAKVTIVNIIELFNLINHFRSIMLRFQLV
jgi:hypothetical protein